MIYDIYEIMESLTEEELYNSKNYPELVKFILDIKEVMFFSEKLNYAIDNYINEETSYIDMLVTDITEYMNKLRILNEDISNFNNIPHDLLIQLRGLQKHFGLIINNFYKIFKENYFKRLEVVGSD